MMMIIIINVRRSDMRVVEHDLLCIAALQLNLQNVLYLLVIHVYVVGLCAPFVCPTQLQS